MLPSLAVNYLVQCDNGPGWPARVADKGACRCRALNPQLHYNPSFRYRGDTIMSLKCFLRAIPAFGFSHFIFMESSVDFAPQPRAPPALPVLQPVSIFPLRIRGCQRGRGRSSTVFLDRININIQRERTGDVRDFCDCSLGQRLTCFRGLHSPLQEFSVLSTRSFDAIGVWSHKTI